MTNPNRKVVKSVITRHLHGAANYADNEGGPPASKNTSGGRKRNEVSASEQPKKAMNA